MLLPLSSEGSCEYTGMCLSLSGVVKPVSWEVVIMWWGAILCTNGLLTIHWSVLPEFGPTLKLHISLKLSI